MLHGRLVENHAAAGGDDAVLQLHADAHFLLDLKKRLQAVLAQNIRQAFARQFLDVIVKVNKRIIQPLGKGVSNRAFSRAGHSDQYNILHSFRLPFQGAFPIV